MSTESQLIVNTKNVTASIKGWFEKSEPPIQNTRVRHKQVLMIVYSCNYTTRLNRLVTVLYRHDNLTFVIFRASHTNDTNTQQHRFIFNLKQKHHRTDILKSTRQKVLRQRHAMGQTLQGRIQKASVPQILQSYKSATAQVHVTRSSTRLALGV